MAHPHKKKRKRQNSKQEKWENIIKQEHKEAENLNVETKKVFYCEKRIHSVLTELRIPFSSKSYKDKIVFYLELEKIGIFKKCIFTFHTEENSLFSWEDNTLKVKVSNLKSSIQKFAFSNILRNKLKVIFSKKNIRLNTIIDIVHKDLYMNPNYRFSVDCDPALQLLGIDLFFRDKDSQDLNKGLCISLCEENRNSIIEQENQFKNILEKNLYNIVLCKSLLTCHKKNILKIIKSLLNNYLKKGRKKVA